MIRHTNKQTNRDYNFIYGSFFIFELSQYLEIMVVNVMDLFIFCTQITYYKKTLNPKCQPSGGSWIDKEWPIYIILAEVPGVARKNFFIEFWRKYYFSRKKLELIKPLSPLGFLKNIQPIRSSRLASYSWHIYIWAKSFSIL